MKGRPHRRQGCTTELLLLLLTTIWHVQGFATQQHPLGRRSSSASITPTCRAAAAASASSSSKPRGMGIAPTKTKKQSFDVSASLLRLEKRYDKLLWEASKRLAHDNEEDDDEDDDDDDDTVVVRTTEYVICTRDKTKKIIQDWVPIAQLCLERRQETVHQDDDQALVQAALSLYCRELSHVAGMGSRVFRALPRHDLEYAVENADSFHKFVYESVVVGQDASATAMTTKEARTVLNIHDDSSLSLRDIKQKYRQRSFECHPDRVMDLTEEERHAAARDYANVQQAFEKLTGSGSVRKDGTSWYESLGGKARTDFRGPIPLLSMAQAETQLATCQSAIMGMNPDLVQSFVARSRTNN